MAPVAATTVRCDAPVVGATSSVRGLGRVASPVVSRTGLFASAKYPQRVVAVRAAEEESDPSAELTDTLNEYASKVTDAWEGTEDKPAVVAIGLAGFVGLWALNGVTGSLEKLPFVGGLLELVGIFVTGWFVYRYLVFGPDREELKSNIDEFLSKITGNDK